MNTIEKHPVVFGVAAAAAFLLAATPAALFAFKPVHRALSNFASTAKNRFNALTTGRKVAVISSGALATATAATATGVTLYIAHKKGKI